MNTEFDVIVVGAGLSGLTAAYKLTQMDRRLKVLVLEAKCRVGGRTLSSRLRAAGDGTDVWDLGGQWVASSQGHILTILKELQLETFPQFTEGKKLLQLNNNQIKSYEGFFPKISLWAALELHSFIRKVEALSKNVCVEDPYSVANSCELDGMTFESFKNLHLRTPEAKQLIDIAFRTTFGFDPCHMSCLHALMYSNAAGGMMRLLETKVGDAQELRVKGGTQQISFLLAEWIGQENILLSHPVTDVIQNEQREMVTVYTSNAKSFRASKLIMAIPVHEAVKVTFTPPLPEPRRALYQNMPMGHLTKFILTYERPFWREMNYSGEIVSNGGLPLNNDCETGPLGIVYDATTHNNNPALVGFISAHNGIQWSTKTMIERKTAVTESLVHFFGNAALEPLEYAEKVWSEETFNGGCPVNIITPGMMRYVGKHLRPPFGRVHWAGTETATFWCGYMNGAVQAGWRAAKEVIHDFRPGIIPDKDLADTAYAKIPAAINVDAAGHKKCGLVTFIQFTLGIGLITAVVWTARKTFFRMAL